MEHGDLRSYMWILINFYEDIVFIPIGLCPLLFSH
jgi:hypothetical protein